MSWLDDLKKRASSAFGNLPTPEFGLSEALGGNPTSVAVKNQGVRQSMNPQVLGATTINAPYGPSAPYGPAAPTSIGGGSNGKSGGSDINGQLQNIASTSKNSTVDAIKSRLGLIRDQVNRTIGTAGSVRDEIKNNIATTYGGLQTAAQQKVASAIDNLNQEKTGVFNTYGTAKGDARRALDSAMTKNRMLARAMGRLDSSFYEDQQANATEAGSRNIAGLGREEAGKVAGIGTRVTDTKNWGEQTGLQIQQEQAQLTSQADQDYSDKVNQAMDMEKAFGIDSTDELKQAEQEYQSKLSGIQQYVENKGMRLAEIAASAGNVGSGISSFDAYTPELQALLGNNTGLTRAQTTAIPTFQDVTQSGNAYIPGINQNSNTSQLDELRRRLGLNLS
jgi:hypothetical protein